MSELLHNLGIDWKLLLASLVNFGILFFLLRKFAYRPILGMLEKRERTIAEALKDSEAVKRAKMDMEQERVNSVKLAKAEAADLLQQAVVQAEALKAQTLAEAKQAGDAMIAKTKAQLDNERKHLLATVRSEVADLVVTATEKILAEKLDSAKDRALVDRVVHQVGQGEKV